MTGSGTAGQPVSRLELAADTPFGPANLPYGVFTIDAGPPRVGVAIGDHVLDAGAAAAALDEPFAPLLAGPSLDPLLAAGRPAWQQVRAGITEWITDASVAPRLGPHLHPRAAVAMRLPFTVGDYVDFYASEDHATNVGKIFRPDSAPLTPNWKHLPIGYHGRSGSVVVSGTDIVRPHGQRKAAADPSPVFGPSQRLDIEAEVGFVIGTGSPMGSSIPVAAFAEHVFGVFLLNDWSARDLQAWEYVPLGPFLGKSFATSISPWIVPLDALAAARVRAAGAGPATAALPAWRRGLGAGSGDRGPAQRAPDLPAAVRGHVLDRRPDARAHDRQRGPDPHR